MQELDANSHQYPLKLETYVQMYTTAIAVLRRTAGKNNYSIFHIQPTRPEQRLSASTLYLYRSVATTHAPHKFDAFWWRPQGVSPWL
jgi:hypothetical protein